MAKGYWGPPSTSCICCSSGPKAKFICLECLHVCKAPKDGNPSCPAGHGEMKNMGQRWRPAKKSKRTKPEPLPYVAFYAITSGKALLEKLLNDKRRIDGNYR